MNTPELPLFPLARWELPPHLDSEPLVAPATARWHGELWGETTNWLVRVVWEEDFGHVFIRAEAKTEEAGWRLPPLMKGYMQCRNDLETAINDHIRVGRLSRYRIFHFSDEVADWKLRLNTLGSKQIHAHRPSKAMRGRISSDAPFDLNWPFDFSSATSAQIESQLMRDWNDEASGLHYARNWMLLSEKERHGQLIRWRRGDEHNFRAMMLLVWCAFAPTLNEEWSNWAFDPYRNWFGFAEWDSYCWNSEVKQPTNFRPWGEALVAWFGPCLNEDLTRQHPCACHAHWLSNNRFWVGTRERTFHEQLEAARTLRDWLDERAARGELEDSLIARLRETLR